MELTHTFTVPVSPEQAFEVLQDIERIGPCMPGASIDSVDGDAFTGTVKVKIGPIKVTYKGEAEYAEIDKDNLAATITARGKESRGSGTANAVVKANLKQVADGAEVHVVTDLAITGRPAQFGRGVMEEVGQKLINQFAECLAERLAEDDPGSAGDPADGEPSDQSGQGGATESVTALGTASTSNGAGSASDQAPSVAAGGTGTKPAAKSPRRDVEAIDLLNVAGAPVAKRAAPVVGGLAVIALIWWLIRRR